MNVTVLAQTVGLFLPLAVILPVLAIGALRRRTA
jgi:hypothetical protein